MRTCSGTDGRFTSSRCTSSQFSPGTAADLFMVSSCRDFSIQNAQRRSRLFPFGFTK